MKYKKGNRILEIKEDTDSDGPRMWDNLGKMICFHKNYTLGDNHELHTNDFNGWNKIEEYLIKELKAEIILPLYLYDHSGITISINPFSCSWDSGQVGFIYTTKEDIRNFLNIKNISKKEIERAKDILKNEVKIYDQYLTGDIYGFCLYEIKICPHCNHKDNEVINSCYGFYGSDFKENGLLEEAEIKDLSKWEEIEE